MTVRSRFTAITIAVTVATALAGCGSSGGGKHTSAAPTPTISDSSPAPVPTPSPTPTPPPPPPTDPLTGGPASANAVIAVKIDDVAAARPQVGVDQADIVYVEQVEGGLTRLVAVFHTNLPTRVGPVRSVRANDPEMLAQYGPIALVASGGGGDSLPLLDQSPLKADINDRGGPGFSRDGSRPVPHNLFINLSQVPKGAAAQSIGWTFSASLAGLAGLPQTNSLSTVVGGTTVGFTWMAEANGWVRVINGTPQRSADGKLQRADNVIVQFCNGHTDYNDIDPAGNPGHFTETVGSGKVAVYRDQHVIAGTWSRPAANGGTTLAAGGAPIALKPGTTWVLLVATGAPLS